MNYLPLEHLFIQKHIYCFMAASNLLNSLYSKVNKSTIGSASHTEENYNSCVVYNWLISKEHNRRIPCLS
jgi:hypothetical protein